MSKMLLLRIEKANLTENYLGKAKRSRFLVNKLKRNQNRGTDKETKEKRKAKPQKSRR